MLTSALLPAVGLQTSVVGLQEKEMPVSISLPTTKDLKRIRRLAKKSRASLACEACKKIRRRCGDYRPCPRCISNGMEASCASELKADIQHISRAERPIPYSVMSIDFRNESAFPASLLKHSWSQHLIQPMWSFGFRFSSYSNIYNSIPPKMSVAMQSLFSSLKTIMQISTQNSSSEAKRFGLNNFLDPSLADKSSTVLLRAIRKLLTR
jgi:nucleotidyltransferase/DNA polymerase involved in DNA repair